MPSCLVCTLLGVSTRGPMAGYHELGEEAQSQEEGFAPGDECQPEGDLLKMEW